MNKKITSYIDGLFADVPFSKKAQDLREELLSTLNDHFEAHIVEGEPEDEAFQKAIGELGNTDELLATCLPQKDVLEKINIYRRKRAKNTSIAVGLYIMGALFICILPAVAAVTGSGFEDIMGIIGLGLLLLCVAIGTVLIVYTTMSVPQEVEPYLARRTDYNRSTRPAKTKRILSIYWLSCAVLYLALSFLLGGWSYTWILWIIAVIGERILELFPEKENEEHTTNESK